MANRSTIASALQRTVSNRRKFLAGITASSLGLLGATTSFSASTASANGSIGYIAVQGAELFVHPDNLSPLLYMDAGVPVDVLYGPHLGLYEIRYYGTDGWVWADYLSLNGSTAPAGDIGGGSSAPQTADVSSGSDEHWIDVNRSSGLVRLMIGGESIAAFWGSLGWEQTDDGFYATAIGSYNIYGFDYSLHYTEYAGNYISHWVAFDPVRYNGFHSYTKDANGNVLPNGAGRTGGCVSLAAGDIDQLYDFAQMGMRVEVHW